MKKVITYGTFDLFHEGHYNILKRAKEYGEYLIVGVTSDNFDVERGKLSVHDSISTRINNVKKTGLADEIIVEEYLGQKISDIIKHEVDVFVIGDDWRGKFDHLSEYCQVEYLKRTANISSTIIRNSIDNSYRIGVITDKVNDNQISKEAEMINNLHVEGYYSENIEIAEALKSQNKAAIATNDLEELFKNTDIIYVGVELEKRREYIEKSIKAKKTVISEDPFSISVKDQCALAKLAQENEVILKNNIKGIYTNVFSQLLWQVKAGKIGEIIRMECSVSKLDISRNNLFYDLASMALCFTFKIVGRDYSTFRINKKSVDGETEFAVFTFEYPEKEAVIKVGNNIRVNSGIEIIGTKGTIRINNNWWKCDKFEVERVGSNEVFYFNENFNGNGFRFLLKDTLRMIESGQKNSKRLTEEETLNIVKVLEEISNR